MEISLPRETGDLVDPDLLAGSLVFGRTEQVSELFANHHKRPPLIDFNNHITAIGRLLEKSKSVDEIKQWIVSYQQRTSDDRNRRN